MLLQTEIAEKRLKQAVATDSCAKISVCKAELIAKNITTL